MHVGMGSGPALDWPTKLKIARGAARGLAYLHEDCKFNHWYVLISEISLLSLNVFRMERSIVE